MSNNDVVGISQKFFNFVNKAHLFDGFERSGDQALTAGQALLIVNVVLGTQATFDSVNRANLAAGIAPFALVLVDLDNAAQFAFTQIADKIRAVFTARICGRIERRDFDSFSSHFDGSPGC